MHYVYSFELSALLVMLIILLHFMLTRRFPVARNYVFFALLCVALVNSISNIASSACLSNMDVVPIWVNHVLLYVFSFSEVITSMLFIYYVYVACDIPKGKSRVFRRVADIFVLVFSALLVTNPWMHSLFYFENGVYHRGWGIVFGYWYTILSIALTLCMVATAGKHVVQGTQLVVGTYGVVACVAILIQLIRGDILLSGTANATLLLCMYLTIQNPNELLDRRTGVANEKALNVCFQNSHSIGREMVLYNIDLRQYNQINASYGYETGSRLLFEVGQFFLEICGAFHVFHLGGDSFVVAVYGEQDPEHIRSQIFSRFENPWEIDELEIMLRVRVVRIDYPLHVKNMLEYLELNSFMKTIIRETGLQPFLKADKEIILRYQRKHAVEQSLLMALENESLEVYYQPVVDMQTERVISMEALVRLRDEKLGFIPPDELVSIAEKNGSVVMLDEQVFEKVCRFLREQILENRSLGIRDVHVNVSVIFFMQTGMAKKILDIMERYGIPAEYITLEVTERAAASVPEMMKKHMETLAAEGISFALDDYGTGNSNCSYLINYPFDKVKFDKTMVWSYFTSKTGKIILDNEVNTIHELHIPIVAEGVETKEQMERLKRLKVEYIQGYYYAKPMPQKEFLEFVREKNQLHERNEETE